MGDLRSELENLDAAFKGAPVQQGRTVLPDGRYQFQLGVPRSGACVSKDRDGATRARVMLTVVSANNPELHGRKTTKSWTLVNSDGNLSEQGAGWFKGDLQTIGLNCAKLSDAGEVLMAAAGTVVDATVQVKADSKGVERENVYFNALAAPAADKPAEAATF